MAATAASTSGGPRKQGARPEINVTPLVDVVLVLLIIFMVVTPQLEAGEAVEVPQIANADEKPKSGVDPVTITATASGKLFWDKDPLAGEPALKARLAAEYAKDPNRRIMIKGDRSKRFGAMRELFLLCQDAGFSGISLVVGEKPKGQS
ncbi:MAG TPA: biopolymer transporter ExbD [Polyangiaceae bacterium]|nr:biopolymer transporter ExbD [Polyangiaceae bacterium]